MPTDGARLKTTGPHCGGLRQPATSIMREPTTTSVSFICRGPVFVETTPRHSIISNEPRKPATAAHKPTLVISTTKVWEWRQIPPRLSPGTRRLPRAEISSANTILPILIFAAKEWRKTTQKHYVGFKNLRNRATLALASNWLTCTLRDAAQNPTWNMLTACSPLHLMPATNAVMSCSVPWSIASHLLS